MSPLIEAHRYFVDLDIIPYVIYHYEVSAREESGLGKVTYNRAPVITFQTARGGGSSARSRQYFARYHDGDFGQDYFEEEDYQYGDDGDASWTDGVDRMMPAPTGDSPFQIMGVAGEMFVIACVILVALSMVALGIAYKVTTNVCLPLICDGGEEDDDEEDDDEEEEEDERDELDIEMEKKLAVLDSDAEDVDEDEDGDGVSDNDDDDDVETENREANVNLV